jgi:hypothetical protein
MSKKIENKDMFNQASIDEPELDVHSEHSDK